ncbi:hypothetical protein [Sphingomonas sp. HMP6]|uniref:hypothetical protein n=1 Tax=Sphingomonas sp. HMP6 TaxID=1517551 RepID=UPI00159677E4|nr:hypothetical protein [Sphingomonas sp. HMP6]BCA57706.1 hypothetical protein HMP06_0475 [Sphingomonas sp. HMP6]
MADTMIERIARHLCKAEFYDPDDVVGTASDDGTDDNNPALYWIEWSADAKVILQLLREPTEAMKTAGVTAPHYLEDQSSRRGCGNIYSAMIDAALTEV